VSAVFDLSGRTAVVTGAASGIGRAAALALAGAGASVVLGDVDAAGLAETAGRLRADAVRTLHTDVSKRADVEALVARALSDFGRVDVIANVAGVLVDGPLTEQAESDLDRVFAVNVKGTLFGCQAAARAMARQGSGSIVNVTSSAAFTPFPTLGAYSISKAGVVALTRSLAAELAPRGVRVNAVAPGMVETPMGLRHALNPDGSFDPGRREQVLAFVRQHNPLGVPGQPYDIAAGILFLAADASRYMTGQVLHLNGGNPMV
jgi:3-oxoacyl-[acyl-carrier protein] reductase